MAKSFAKGFPFKRILIIKNAQELDEYVHEHFYRTGVATVFVPTHKDKSHNLVLCIESHQFQPKNYWFTLNFSLKNPRN